MRRLTSFFCLRISSGGAGVCELRPRARRPDFPNEKVYQIGGQICIERNGNVAVGHKASARVGLADERSPEVAQMWGDRP